MPTAQPLRTGDPHRLGEYELSGRLGEGGQGAVFLGSRGGETFAVKLLHGPVGDERAAFLREVELAKHVARFCTAQVIDAGFDEGRPYIVSEYVDGPSLQREVALTGPRRGGTLERLAVGTATALTAIHRAGIVHRDFKPQNVLLGSDGPRVIDFGLARALDAAATVSGRGVGTPAYMAPEQITASAVTGAADVFSWGATMCFAANATAPFGQDSVAPVLHRILTAPPELGRLDGRLRTLVEACLDKDVRNRPSSRELLFELLGEQGEVPGEVLSSPPAHILRVPPILVAEPRSPIAEPESTGMPGAYVLPGSQPSTSDGSASGDGSASVGGPASGGPATGGGPVSGESASGGGPASGESVSGGGSASGGSVLGAGGDGHPSEPGWTGGSAAPVRLGSGPDAGWFGAGSDAGRFGSEDGRMGAGSDDGRMGAAGGHSSGDSGPAPGAGGDRGAGPDSPEPRERSRKRWPGAAIAVCAALLVTAAVLLTVLVPILNRNEPASRAAGQSATPPVRSEPPQTEPQEQKPSPTKAEETREEREPTTDPPVVQPVTVPVPALEGMDRAAAIKAIKRAGLAAGTVSRLDSPQEVGQVLSSSPASGTAVAKGSTVSLQVSAGVAVPSVTGMQRQAAEAAVTGAGLTVGEVTRSCADQPAGEVLSTQPKAGSRVTGGSPVALTVARNGATVPSVVDRPTQEGRAALTEAGFTVRSRGQVVADESRVGTILSQSIQPGNCAKPGATIVIVVGLEGQQGPDPGEPSGTPTSAIAGH
ncbi:PASTA domain-containing protein [Nonomuraea sp. K274]|uniref:non-specific serine/threonine protein kinase n=1 Tax=Nonomuraea cypriaca TaxID=1187855 RepID=A0A931AKG0_9ACTN|nr:PASTA domain-containing protein [Nonomuraea cypriaca]MBF8194216.1 PASTA domain-containing protein [Nonomuraea cypriaca]